MFILKNIFNFAFNNFVYNCKPKNLKKMKKETQTKKTKATKSTKATKAKKAPVTEEKEPLTEDTVTDAEKEKLRADLGHLKESLSNFEFGKHNTIFCLITTKESEDGTALLMDQEFCRVGGQSEIKRAFTAFFRENRDMLPLIMEAALGSFLN